MDADILASFPQFSRLDAESLRLVDQTARKLIVPAGTIVFQDGSQCASYMLVMEGSVRVQKVSENGREIVLYRVESGQSCVLTTNCLIAREDYSAEAIAETEVRALVLPATTFRTLLGRSEPFRDFVFSAYATRISDLLMLLEEVAFGRIDVRLASWLRQRADSSGEVKATHQDIATELGTAREVISRQLKEFERRGWLTLYRGRVVIVDAEGLKSLI